MKVGVAFSDSISTEKVSKRRNYDDTPFGSMRMRGFLLPVLLFLAIGVLLVRVFFVEVLRGNYYRGLSDENRIKTIVIHSPRGIIFDRNHTPLVFNTPGFRKIEDPSGGIQEKRTVQLTQELALQVLAQGEKNLEIDSLRQYPYKDAMAHVLGYIGQISKDELKDTVYSDYKTGDLLGKSGIEKQYEATLRGNDGKQLVEIDAMGKTIRTLGQTDPIPGNDITLTLDVKLQTAAFEGLKDVKKGAVVVTTPEGEVVTLVSKPSFDPNLFTLRRFVPQGELTSSGSAYASVDQILTDGDNQPLLNRSIGGVYPPGSTFKLVTSASGLENNVIDEKFEVEDNGVITVGAFSFSNWYFTEYGRTEGLVNVVKAIKRSNDIFFYVLADKIGVDKLSKTARSFGIGEKSGIDLEGEAEGLVPDEKWKQKELGEGWYLGDSYHYGIGQGFLLTTPLQVNGWTRAVASGGTLYQPHLLKSSKLKVKSSKLVSSKNLELIREGMVESCSPGGVAWPLFEFKIVNSKLQIDGRNILETAQSTSSAQFKDQRHITVACKTGTAQHGGETTLPHAWITLFAPAYDPQIVVTVLAETSGEGSNIAAPIAKEILQEWFEK